MPTIVGKSSGASSTASVTALAAQNTPASVGAQAGDLIIVTASQERSGLPIVNLPDLTEIRTTSSGSDACYVGWKRLTSSDLTSNISVTSNAGANRRMQIGYVIYRNAANPVPVISDRVSNGNGVLTAIHPNITITSNNVLLMSVMNAFSNVSPYLRTFNSESGWTTQISSGSAQTDAVNSFVHLATKQVSNATGTTQTGHTVTDTQEKFAHYDTTIAINHQNAASPILVNAGTDVTADPYSKVTLTAVVSGGVTPYKNLTWTQTSGPTLSTTTSGNNLIVTVPPLASQTLVTFRFSALDNEDVNGFDEVVMTVIPNKFVIKRGGQVKFFEKFTRRGTKLVSAVNTIEIGAAQQPATATISITSPASGATVVDSFVLSGIASDGEPVVAFTQPAQGADISGTVVITGTASD